MGELVMPVTAIRAAGAASAQVAGGVGGVDLGTPCAYIAAALPGSRCARAGAAAADAWRTEIADVTARMARQAQNLADSADTYERHEQWTVATLASILAGLPGAATGTAPSIRQALG